MSIKNNKIIKKMSESFCAVKPVKWKELAEQTSEDVVIRRYAITGEQNLDNVFQPYEEIVKEVTDKDGINIEKLNEYNLKHNTGHFAMEITNSKGEKRNEIVINPIPYKYIPIGGADITKEKIDSYDNKYLNIRKKGHGINSYYYSEFNGYTTIENLKESLSENGFIQDGSEFTINESLDEEVVEEKSNLLTTKVKFLKSRFDDKINEDVNIEEVSDISGRNKSRIDYLFGTAMSRLIDLKNKYKQDINNLRKKIKETSDSNLKEVYFNKISELEIDVKETNDFVEQLKEGEIYKLYDKLEAFSKFIELAKSKSGSIISQVNKYSKNLKTKLGHSNGGMIKAIDYVKNNKNGIIPYDQLSILSKQQHLLDQYTNLDEISEFIKVMKENISDKLSNYSNDSEASFYLTSLDRLMNDMEQKIIDVENGKKSIESDLDNMIRQTSIAVFALSNDEALARWESEVYDKLKKEAENQYHKDLENMSKTKAKEIFNEKIKDRSLWKEAKKEAAKDSSEKTEYIFKLSEQELTEVEDIPSIQKIFTQQGRISDTAAQIIFKTLAMVEQKSRSQYIDDVNKKGGLLQIVDALKEAGLSLSNYKDIIKEVKRMSKNGEEITDHVIKTIFKKETTDKLVEFKNKIKEINNKLDELYSNDEEIKSLENELFIKEQELLVSKNILNKSKDSKSLDKYSTKIKNINDNIKLLTAKIENKKNNINESSNEYKELKNIKKLENDYKLDLINASKAISKYYETGDINELKEYESFIDTDITSNYKLFKAVYMLTKGFYDLNQKVPYSLQNLTHKSKIYNVQYNEKDGYVKINDQNLNMLTDEVILPKIDASKFEIIKNRGIKDFAQQSWSDLVQIQESDRAEGIGITYDVDIKGNPIKRIRRNYINPLDKGVTQSFDLINLFAMESVTVNRYMNRSEVKDELETMVSVMNSRNVRSKKGFSERFTKTKFGGFTQRIFKSKEDIANVNKVIEAMMDAHIYGAEIKSTGSEVMDNLLNKITGFTAVSGYVGNLLAATSNLLVGTAQNFSEVFGQQYFTFKDSRLASIKMVGYLNKYYQSSLDLVDNSFLGVVFRELNIQGAFNDKFNFDSKYESRLQDVLFNAPSYIGQINKQSEFLTQAPLVVAILQGVKITNKDGEYLDKEGNIVKNSDDAQSLLDILEVKNGKLSFKIKIDELYLSQKLNKDKSSSILYSGSAEDILKHSIGRYIEDIMFKTQGMYNSFNSPIGKMNPYLAPLFQYRMFMDEYLRNTYGGITTLFKDMGDSSKHGGKYYNPATGNLEMGTVTSFLKWYYSRPGDHLLFKKATVKLMNMFNVNTDSIRKEITNEAAWNELTDSQKADVSRFIYYACLNASLVTMALFLSALKEDDPDDEYVDAMNLLVRRMQNEIMFVWNIGEFLQFFSNPAAAVRTIQLASNLVNTAFWTVTELAVNGEVIDGRYKNGEHKGDLKVFHRATDLLPYASFIKFFKDENYIADRLKFYSKTY